MYAAESPIVGWSKFSAKARGGWDSSIKYFPCDETQEAGNKDPQMKPWVLNGFEAKVKDKETTMVQQTCDSGVASSTGVTCSGCGYMVLVAPYIKAMLRAQGGKNARKWDDALDVWGVHGMGGLTGAILTGTLASPHIWDTGDGIGAWTGLEVKEPFRVGPMEFTL
jgi:hypothetical protein